jgi:UTP--glucose-1-phosphate uridylyltransferase
LRFEGKRYDCGSRLGFIEANIAFSMRDPEIGAQVQNIVRRFADELGHSEEVPLEARR